MPVIPYTLSVTCLGANSNVVTTLSVTEPNKAHETLQMDHDSGRRGGDLRSSSI